MDQQKIRKIRATLEVVTNLAVLAVCITIGVVLLRGRTATSQTAQAAQTINQGIAKGDMFPNVGAVKYDQASETLVLALNTRCHFCKESLPFYRKLVAQNRGAQIVALFPNPDTEVRDYLETEKLSVQKVAELDFAKFQIGGTPTLVLVDRSGKVRNVWNGKLTDAGQKEVLSALVF
jgi:thiol-disulfide isomerase/thioredoxin